MGGAASRGERARAGSNEAEDAAAALLRAVTEAVTRAPAGPSAAPAPGASAGAGAGPSEELAGLEELLAGGACDLQTRDRQGRPLLVLVLALAGGRAGPGGGGAAERVLRLLLAAGADPNARCERDGATALMRNACLGSEAINELLLAARADLDLQDKEGKTALMCAVEFNHSKIALALMGAGAKLDMQSSTGRSALLEVRC